MFKNKLFKMHVVVVCCCYDRKEEENKNKLSKILVYFNIACAQLGSKMWTSQLDSSSCKNDHSYAPIYTMSCEIWVIQRAFSDFFHQNPSDIVLCKTQSA